MNFQTLLKKKKLSNTLVSVHLDIIRGGRKFCNCILCHFWRKSKCFVSVDIF